MSREDDELDSDRNDNAPRRRGRHSCGPERLCGADDCVSCFPNGVEDEDDVEECEHYDEDDEEMP